MTRLWNLSVSPLALGVALLLCLITPRIASADWVTPTGHTNGTGWSNGNLARDGSTTTYASHQPALGWGGWQTLSLSAAVWSDRFRVMSDFGYGEVDSVQVEVSPDNVGWTTVHAGAVADATWDTRTHAAQTVQHIRFRYHRISTGYIFWLYELHVFETPLTIDLPTITTTAATSIDETSAAVHGLLDDDGGIPCDVRFQYGLTLGYELGSTQWVPDYVTGNTSGAMITGLTSGLTYHFRAQARNSQGTSDGPDATFTCAPVGPGWVSPNSSSDATARWENQPNAYDDEVSSFAKCLHPSGDPSGQWSPYLYLLHPSLPTDSIRFYAKDDSNIDRAQVDISPDGTTWFNVYDAAFVHQTWTTPSFSPQHVNQARVRFRVANNGTGLYWDLHEFDYYLTPRPVLDDIGPQAVAEGDTLTFDVSATDVEGDSLTLSAVSLPANASFADSGDGTGSLTFLPDFTQAGVYNVTFIASDGALADSEAVAITVTDVNRTPVLATIGPQLVAEGDTLNLGVNATDPDGDSLTLTAQNLPANASFADSGDGTGSLTFLPDFTQAGVYNVTFIASDGALADSEMVAITVTDLNQAPVLAAIGPQAVAEGDTLTLGVNATDADGDSLILSAGNLPTNASFADNGDGTGSLTFLPDFTQAGLYSVTFTASDGVLTDSEVVAITVTELNQAPVLAPTHPQSVAEGDTLTFAVSATDNDGDTLTLLAGNLPTHASFVDDGDGTGRLTFLPDFTQAGLYRVTFTASDGALADGALVAITVKNVNRAPVLDAIGAQSVAEGDTLTVGVSATDDAGESLFLSAENLPANASFVDHGDGTGRLTFLPGFTQAGVYHVTFAASDGALDDGMVVVITVADVNRAPVLSPIGPPSVAEGDTLTVSVGATDDDGDPLALSAENLPLNASFLDNGDGTGHLSFLPDFTQAGIYHVTLVASDGTLADSAPAAMVVTDVNLAPVLDPVGPQSVREGDTLTVSVTAIDHDGDSLALSAENLPGNAAFVDLGDGTGRLTFLPDFTQAGVYDLTFVASDGVLAGSAPAVIAVTDVNRAPVLATIGPQSVAESDTLTVTVNATDDDGDSLNLSAEDLPPHADFVDHGDGAGRLTFLPDFAQAGAYNVTIIASDGALAESQPVAVTVTNLNRAPELAAIDPRLVAEGDTLTVSVGATDIDGDRLFLAGENLPTNTSFTDHGDGTGSLSFLPDFTQAGLSFITLHATDGALADSAVVAITITDVNRAPLLAAIDPASVAEGDTLTVAVSAQDDDGDSLFLSAAPLPTHASFTDHRDGTGSLSFLPDFTQAGFYSINLSASDGALADSAVAVITVAGVNRMPAISPIGLHRVEEGDTLTVSVSVSDADGDSLALSAENLPTNGSFADHGNGSGSLRFHPDFTQAGSYNVTFIASDGAASDTTAVALVVGNVNRAPALAAIGPQSVAEGDTLTFGIRATDADGDSLVLSADHLPANASFADSRNGTGTLSFLPDFTQDGVYRVVFIAADGAAADSEWVAFTVTGIDSVTISGNAGIGGAALHFVDDTTRTTLADSAGVYSLKVPYRWSGTAAPSKTDYEFSPSTRVFDTISTHQIDQDFTATFTKDDGGGLIPDRFHLAQNYPNPLHQGTILEYSLPVPTHVLVEVYNLLGQNVVTLVNEERPAGVYRSPWEGADRYGRPVSSGTYLYRIIAGDFRQSRKMTLLK